MEASKRYRDIKPFVADEEVKLHLFYWHDSDWHFIIWSLDKSLLHKKRRSVLGFMATANSQQKLPGQLW